MQAFTTFWYHILLYPILSYAHIHFIIWFYFSNLSAIFLDQRYILLHWSIFTDY